MKDMKGIKMTNRDVCRKDLTIDEKIEEIALDIAGIKGRIYLLSNLVYRGYGFECEESALRWVYDSERMQGYRDRNLRFGEQIARSKILSDSLKNAGKENEDDK